MHRTLLTLLLVTLGIALAGLAARPVHAGRPTLVVGALGPPQYLEPRPHGLEGFTHQQAVLLLADSLLNRALELHFRDWLAMEKPEGWECIEVRASGSPSDTPDRVHVGYDFVPAQEADLQLGRINVWRVTIQIGIRGMKEPVKKTQSLRLPDYGVVRYDDDLEEHVADRLLRDILDAGAELTKEALDELKQKKMVPCKPKAKLKGKGSHRAGDVTQTHTFAADFDLTLDGEGKFQAAASAVWTIEQTAPPHCTVTWTVERARMSAGGGYRDADGSLTFTEIRLDADASVLRQECESPPRTTPPVVVCIAETRRTGEGNQARTTYACNGIVQSVEESTLGYPFATDLAVTLADEASVPIPAPGPWDTWEASLTLSYGGEGAGSASATSAAGDPFLAE